MCDSGKSNYSSYVFESTHRNTTLDKGWLEASLLEPSKSVPI